MAVQATPAAVNSIDGTGTHWARIGESTFVWGIALLAGVHRVAGRLPFRLLLYPVVTWYWAMRGPARRASFQYLERMQAAHGNVCAPGERMGWRHTLRHFIAFAESILDKTLAVSGRYVFERSRMVGREPVARMLELGQGGVFVTAHIGCLELVRANAERRIGLKLNVLVHTRHAERFNRLLARLDPEARVRLIQVSEVGPATAALLAERVAAGEFVAIAADRVPLAGGRTVRASFLGHEAPFPAGPWVIAALLQCPVWLMACVHEDDHYAVHFEHVADRVVLPRGARETAIAGYAADYVQRLEHLLAGAPYDWFNFYDFWDQPT